MKRIVVCIKAIPQSDSELGIEINKYDFVAIEQAIKIKKILGYQVVVISMGTLKTQNALFELSSFGVDRVILLNDIIFAGSDTLATANVLSECIKKIEDVEIVICGEKTSDGGTSHVGPELGELLRIHVCTFVTSITQITSKYILLSKDIGTEQIEIKQKLPALLTISSSVDFTLLPSIDKLIEAHNKNYVEIWNNEFLKIDKSKIGIEGSRTKVISQQTIKKKSKCEFVNIDTIINKLEMWI